MALLNMRLCCIAFVLLLWTPQSQCRNYTHEDIRETLISVVHLLRITEDKLERHEFREKALGEHVKKLLMGLEKKHRALEPMKGTIIRMDERLANVETVLMEKASDAKNAQLKTNDALDKIQKSLQSLTITVQNMKPTKPTEIDNNLTTNEDTFERRLDSTDAKIDGVMREIESLKHNLNKDALRSMCQTVDTKDVAKPFGKHLSDAEKLLSKFELKLNEYNCTRNTPTDVLSEIALADEAWHSKMTDVMDRQGEEITKVRRLLSDAESTWKELPRLKDLQQATNMTLDAVVNATETLKENDEKAVSKMTAKLRDMGDRLENTNKDIQQSLTQGNTLTERAFSDISRSYESLRPELQTLSRTEQVMLQTADNVIANKKRIEHGVQQILKQVSELVLRHGQTLNLNISDRLDKIESTVMDNQAITLVNLSSKIETEMSQVWRQIGIMHEQLSKSKDSLDKLNELSEKYINSSTTSITKVKDEVVGISSKMITLGDDFNYALGRLALVTQEFKQISSGISDALTSLKEDVQTAKKDAGPGPHKIESEEKTT